jgi:hypothetical protein
LIPYLSIFEVGSNVNLGDAALYFIVRCFVRFWHILKLLGIPEKLFIPLFRIRPSLKSLHNFGEGIG